MNQSKKYSPLKKTIFILLLLMIAFWGFVEISNRNSTNMTARQKVLKAVYPLWMWFAGKKGTNTKNLSNEKVVPAVSFYSLKDTAINGTTFDFEKLKGKKVMLVNTASDCGYTGQYDDLQKLSEQYKDKLVVIGFPANDFKEQEKGTDDEIASFCKLNFGVSFPLMKKSTVIKGANQNKIFDWLTDATKNGWNDQQPSWNFCKYIVDEEGRLTKFLGSTIEPLGKEVTEALNH
ncbi:MAG: glutathione peroxidase [Ferruginibacter sp.]